MNIKRITLLTAAVAMALVSGTVTAQSYYDDDLYYDASKEPKQSSVVPPRQDKPFYLNTSPGPVVAEYPSADTYTINGTRQISVDDYNRRGIFATDSLTEDTTATDFAYTRRIEQFYNPEVVSGSGDQELAAAYYSEPTQVNIYVNTPSSYWGYDYFYPSYSPWYNPYWSPGWRWGSAWYWNSWYDPYWSWNWGWGPSWGWGRPYNPRHPGAGLSRPGRHPSGSAAGRPGNNTRPAVGVGGNRHQGAAGARPGYNGGYGPSGRPSVGTGTQSRPSNSNNGYNRPSGRPSVGTGTQTRPSNSNNNYNRPSNSNNNNNYNRPSYNTNGSRTPSYNSGGGNRGGGFSGGSRGGGRSSSGGRGRH